MAELSVRSHWTAAEVNWSMPNDISRSQDLISLISVDKSAGHLLAVFKRLWGVEVGSC